MADHELTIIDDWRVTRTARLEGLALAKRAEAAGRPVAVDLDEGSAFLGVSAEDRGKQLASLRSEEHTSELQSHSEISYAVFCLEKKKVS